jgi:hypothetical protein
MGSGLSTGETFRWHGSRASVRLGRQSLDGMAPSSRWSAKAPYPEGAQFLARLLRIETGMVTGELRLIEMPYGDLSRKICAPQPSAGLPALRGRAGATSFEGAIPSQTLHPAAVSRLMPRAILRTSSVIGNIFAASFWRFGFASGSLRARCGRKGAAPSDSEKVVRPGPAGLVLRERTTTAVSVRFRQCRCSPIEGRRCFIRVLERVGRSSAAPRRARDRGEHTPDETDGAAPVARQGSTRLMSDGSN